MPVDMPTTPTRNTTKAQGMTKPYALEVGLT